MVTWNNLDTLASFKELEEAKGSACGSYVSEMEQSGVKKYSVPLVAEGLI